MELTFCKICRQQLDGDKGHNPVCPHSIESKTPMPTHIDELRPISDEAWDDLKPEPGHTTTVTLNRKQRRQAVARAKIRMRKEKR